ncbi:MAG: alpha/beta hydrolase [Pseudomonadales bacterium RIFCSPLOWO2_12_59_9]|nr:MAG: alpha/beta hydrolase [Pseudomonadales bacterium RIFCSPLOWO2_12_59_9]
MRSIALCLLALLLAGCDAWLFYPERELAFNPSVAGLEFTDVFITAADGTRLHAWWLPAKAGVAVQGTVLHLHGNGGNVSAHLGGSWWLPAQGYQVLLLDYRGYGRSQGEPDLRGAYQDIDAGFAWLAQAPQVQGKPLVLLGQSLGGAMGVHYLAEHPLQRARLKALVLDGVPASYADMAQYTLSSSWLTWPLQVPLSWLMPESDSAIYAMPQLEGLPTLLYQSLDDEVVPLSNGVRLYQAARPPRVLQPTRGGHVQTFAEPLWREVMLRYLDDPQGFVGLRRLAEIPISHFQSIESPQ